MARHSDVDKGLDGVDAGGGQRLPDTLASAGHRGGVLPDAEGDAACFDLRPEVGEMVRRARGKDAATIAALAYVGRWLGHGVSILANVANPELVVLGGHYAALAEWLLPHAEAELRQRSVIPDFAGCRMVPASLAHEAVALGSAARMLDNIDTGQLPLPQLAYHR